MPQITLQSLNSLDRSGFVAVCGRFFERSPWIADRAWQSRPWTSRESLYRTLCDTLALATLDEKIDLICAHPDLVGKAAAAGELTDESAREQSAAGLGELSPEDIDRFRHYNSAYRNKFSFPFVICARQNKKEAILAAFPQRLGNTRDQEIAAALCEIEKIARLRLMDAILEG